VLEAEPWKPPFATVREFKASQGRNVRTAITTAHNPMIASPINAHT
jgi:hypothetical protein